MGVWLWRDPLFGTGPVEGARRPTGIRVCCDETHAFDSGPSDASGTCFWTGAFASGLLRLSAGVAALDQC